MPSALEDLKLEVAVVAVVRLRYVEFGEMTGIHKEVSHLDPRTGKLLEFYDYVALSNLG
jgi:hypothetical protein